MVYLPLALSLSLLLPSVANAQSLDIVVIGRVSDATGGALPGATVVATSVATGIARTTVTDAHGRYTLFNLAPRIYTVRAELDGFAPTVRQAHTFYVGTTITIDFALAVSGAEQVTVRGTLPSIETTRNTLSRVVQQDEIDALPVIDRNFNDLAALAPGVTKTGVYGGVDIGGNRDFQNGYQFDGVSVERHHAGDQRIAFAQDWVQEFQVLTSQFNVEFGQAAGGVLNVISRSGGNDTTGRLYSYFRNGAWDATPAFTTRKPPLHEHRVGVTIGGPLVKNRVFYFGGIERFSNANSRVVNSTFARANGTFPSTDARTLSLAKVEIAADAAHTIRVRHNGQRQTTTGSSVGGISTEEHGRFSDLRANDFAGGWSWIMSPTRLNEARASWGAAVPTGGCNFASRNAPGTWFERAYPGAQFGCPVNFGTIAEHQLQVIDNLLWTHGSHDVKVGVQASWTRSDGDFRNFRDGRYSFERDLAFTPADPLSYPFSFVLIEGPTEWDLSAWSVGMFAQDNWRMTDDLALSAGVRYDIDNSLTALNPLIRTDKGVRTIDGDVNNVAPRVGFAWTPLQNGKRTLLRGGAGVYYDQNHNNVATLLILNNILVDRTIVVNANSALLNPFWPDIARAKSFLADALARNTVPDLSLIGDFAASTNGVDHDLRIPATRQMGAGMAHEFRRWFNASADLVYTWGVDLYVIRNTNLNQTTFQRLNPGYSSISSFGNGGTSRYRALQLQANIIASTRHFAKLGYTWASNRSNTATTLSAGTATNPFDYAEDAGPSDNDVRHAFTMNGSSSLPLGVQLSGILGYRSALPYSGATAAPRPDGKPFGFRPEPRNTRRGDSAMSLDVRIGKNVRLGRGRSATAFLEMFNLTNQLNYASYTETLTSTSFGQPTTAGPMRRIQLGVRFDF
jgi:hypothetical protein